MSAPGSEGAARSGGDVLSAGSPDRFGYEWHNYPELRSEYGDDRRGYYEAAWKLHQEEELPNPLVACLDPWIAVSLLHSVVFYAPMLRSARRQGLHDRLAHAVVIRAR